MGAPCLIAEAKGRTQEAVAVFILCEVYLWVAPSGDTIGNDSAGRTSYRKNRVLWTFVPVF
jgi:hypothetical protein